MKEKKAKKVILTPRRLKAGLRVKTGIKAGPTRRAELDHIGAY
jgi:hypothetical protein